MTATNQFPAHIGLDWADKKHYVCVQFKNGERVFHVIEHTAEALDPWLVTGKPSRPAVLKVTHRMPS